MDLLMNGLLATAALFAGGYCWVLARRVHDLQSLDRGLGASIVALTRQIELARTTLDEARGATSNAKNELAHLVGRAETVSAQLRLLVAAAVREADSQRHAEPAAAASPAPGGAAPAPPAARPAVLEPAPMARAAAAPATEAAELPKPRAMPPLESLLRKRVWAENPTGSEDELIEALSALAGRGR